MIKIILPNPNDFEGADNIKPFLRQLELCVHHAQKAFEQMEKDKMVGEESYIIYRFPEVNLYSREEDEKGFVKVHVDEESSNFMKIELEIN